MKLFSAIFKGKKMTGSSQPGFTNRKLGLTNLTAFCKATTSLAGNDFSQAFDAVSRNILTDMLMECMVR